MGAIFGENARSWLVGRYLEEGAAPVRTRLV